eukprot:2706167-Lingulodinium_polyedra.AAC.1
MGPIAKHPRKALQNVGVVGHEPGGFLERSAVDLGHHPEHAEVKIGKPSLRELSEAALNPWVRPRGCRQGVLQHKRPACQQLDTHDEEAEFQEGHRHFHPMLPHMPWHLLPVHVQQRREPSARGLQVHDFWPAAVDLLDQVLLVFRQQEIPPCRQVS